MSDWQAGMLARCVKRDDWEVVQGFGRSDKLPAFGEVYRVSYVEDGRWLKLEEFDPIDSFHHTRFVPVKPSAIEHIEALKRVPEPVREMAFADAPNPLKGL